MQGYAVSAGTDATICQGQNTTLAGTVVPGAGIYQDVHTGYTFNSQTGVYSNFSGGTVIFNSSNSTMDDDVSGAITIPAFTFNNQTFTSIYVSTNGFITFGSAPASTEYFPISGTAAYAGCVAAYGTDIGAYSTSSSDVRYNQIGGDFVIQWKNFGRFNSFGSVDEELSFQIILTPATNKISVIYSSVLFTSTATYYPQVGLRGPNNTYPANINNRTIALQGGYWLNNTTAGSSNASTCALNGFPNTTQPQGGTVFVWTPAAFLPVTYSWSPTAGLSSTSVLNPTAAPSGTTTYTLTANYGSCSSSSSVLITVDVCSGITEADNAGNFGIYPNPSSGEITLLNKKSEKCIVNIYNAAGELVKSITAINAETIIDISDLKAGIYNLMTIGDKNMNNMKFIKQ